MGSTHDDDAQMATTVEKSARAINLHGTAHLQHLRNMVGTTIAFVIVGIVDKGGLDLLVPAAAAWLALSFLAVSRTRSAASFAVWNVVLLLADSLLDIVAMGTHLPSWIGAPEILPWGTSSFAQAGVIAYWILLWGLAVPNRVLGMLDRTDSISRTGRVLLFLAVIGLHIAFVEDVVYFAILGYPPFAIIPPQNYVYLPHAFWMSPWTATGVWIAASVGVAFYVVAVTVAIRTASRTRLHTVGLDGMPG